MWRYGGRLGEVTVVCELLLHLFSPAYIVYEDYCSTVLIAIAYHGRDMSNARRGVYKTVPFETTARTTR